MTTRSEPLTGGNRSTLTGGYGSTLISQWWDEDREQWRMRMAEVREGGLEAGVTYRLVSGKFIPVVPQPAQATA